MPSRKIEDLAPALQPLCRKFLENCKAENIGILITCTYRSNAEQTALYNQGRTTPGHIVTNAKAGTSAHNHTTPDGRPDSHAFDICVIDSKGELDWNDNHPAWARAGAIGEALGLEWGGHFHSFVDKPHFQLKGG